MNLIAAVSENWGIGKNNKLLFRIPSDMKFFRETTVGGAVIMGRKTLESFPGGKPLRDRMNVVLTHNPDFECEGAVVCRSKKEAAEMDFGTREVFVIGGESVYRQMLDLCDTCYITKVFERADADAFMVNLDADEDWSLTEQSEKTEDNGHLIRFCRYERVKRK
ncbi:MAG: dihydrofolate reductase [Firmicutes bacterium]|nr:dihydrofolate reductase [Bacillota bacterium]